MYGLPRHLHDAHAQHRDSQRLRLEPISATGDARPPGHVTGDVLADVIRLGFDVPAFEAWDHSLVIRLPPVDPSSLCGVRYLDALVASPVEDHLQGLRFELRHWDVHRKSVCIGQR